MTTTTTKYKVKAEKVIYHAGLEYVGGSEVELHPRAALHHAENIEIVPPATTVDLKPLVNEQKKPEPKP